MEENGNALIKVSLQGLTNTTKNLSQDDLDVLAKRARIAQSVQQQVMSWMAEVQFLVEARFFPSPQCPDRFWGPPTLLHRGADNPLAFPISYFPI
jgi:hypothetical protein